MNYICIVDFSHEKYVGSNLHCVIGYFNIWWKKLKGVHNIEK